MASESPFYNRLRPGAFGPLNEILFSIRQAVAEYDSWLQLDLVPPSNVKQALGAKGNCGKPEMIEALLSNKNITDKYPNYKNYTASLYLQGFLLDNYLNDDAKAKVIYEEVIAKYPTTIYADNAKMAIRNLGKSDDELIKEFKKKNGQK